jgi:energy-coupling factor transporter ATP-binding protein EcfA2
VPDVPVPTDATQAYLDRLEANIPNDWKAEDQFVPIRGKVPWDHERHKPLDDWNEPESLLSWRDALALVADSNTEIDHIGWCPPPRYTALDVDDADLYPERTADILSTLDSWTERSLSGNGYHCVVEDIPPSSGWSSIPRQLEIRRHRQQIVLTGDVLPDYAVVRRGDEEESALATICTRYLCWNPRDGTISNDVQPPPPLTDDEIRDIIDRATPSHSEKFRRLMADQKTERSNTGWALLRFLAFYTWDADQIARFVERAAFYANDYQPGKSRPHKWSDPAFLSQQIRKAISECQKTYGGHRTDTRGHEPPQASQEQPPVNRRTLVLTSLANVQSKPPDWLWHRWLAKGKVHIIGGHAGNGKSTITANIAAILSTAGTWPDGTQSPLGRTLFLLAEDALDDTLKPRLIVHGADTTRISAIEGVRETDGSDRLFNIEKNLTLLEEAIENYTIALLVIDPISSFMPKANRNDEGDVRDVLTPLGKMAERTGAAVLCVMHVGKGDGTNRRPLQQLLGSTAFGAVARAVWVVAKAPPEKPGLSLLGVTKSNLAMKPKALEWSRAEDEPIVWHGASAFDIDAALQGTTANPRENAKGFLSDLLADGPVEAKRAGRHCRPHPPPCPRRPPRHRL